MDAASPMVIMRLGLGFICVVKFRHFANNDKAMFFIPALFLARAVPIVRTAVWNELRTQENDRTGLPVVLQ